MKALLTMLLLALVFTGAAQTIPPPTQTDELIIDNGQSGKADPADRIRYKVTIQNTGGADATGTQLKITPDPRTTFTPGSFRSSPLAVPDAYAVTGNVGIDVSAANGLRANDFDDDIAGASLTAGTFATTQGGSIMINADGSFMYTPPVGLTGGMTDTYTYTLNDGNGVGGGVPATDMATVTFTLNNLIWFIDNGSPAATSDGRLTSPFKTLADFNAGSATAGEVVYIKHTGTNYGGGIVLANNERLFGEGHGGGSNLADVLGGILTLAPHSKTLPAIGGTRPVITNINAGGDGILLAQNNTVRGVDVGNSADFAIDDNGAVGTLTVSEVNINNASGGGFRANNGGTLAVTLGSLSASGGASGIHLGGTGGSFSVTGATTISNSSTSGILIDATSAGATTSFAVITVGNTGSHAIQLINNTGTFTASGTTTINSPAAGANISLNISGGSGAITFATLDINGRRDKGIRIGAGNRNITTGVLDIDNPNTSTAIGLEIVSPTGGTISFGTTTINNGGASGSAVEIQSSAAAVTFASGSAISNSASHEFFVNGGNGNITYNGALSSTAGQCLAVNSRTGGTTSFTGNITSTGAGIGIAVGANTGGTVNFSGSSKSITSGNATGVSLIGNTGATVNFTGGGLAISTTSATGFTATGGGTVTVSGSNNTITTTTGTALNVANTTIGGSGLNFRSISSNGGGDPGIVLNNTGGSGGLTVTGSGGAGTGGTIQNKSGNGISLQNTFGTSLSSMNIYYNSGSGIYGDDVTDFSISNSNVTNNADVATGEEANMRFIELLGNCSISSCNFSGSFEDEVRITPASGTLTNLTVNASTFGPNSATTGGHGIAWIGTNNAGATINVTNCSFQGIRSTSALMNLTDNCSGTINVSNSSFTNCGVAVTLQSSLNADLNFNVSNNPTIVGCISNAIQLVAGSTSTNASEIRGTISGNVIGNGTADSGSRDMFGIGIDLRGDQNAILAITGNTVRNTDFQGIWINSADFGSNAAQNGTLNLTLTGNTVATPDDNSGFPVGFLESMLVDVRHTTFTTANIQNNTVSNGVGGQAGIRVRQRDTSTFRLERLNGGSGTVNVPATVQTHVSGENAGSTCNTTIANFFTGVANGTTILP